MSTPSAEYMREYRASRPDYTRRNRALIRARSRALERLAANHLREFDALYVSECEADGIEPPHPSYRTRKLAGVRNPAKRLCAQPNCGALLSIYNPAEHCALHAEAS